eukprot:tig00021493_g21900.t1
MSSGMGIGSFLNISMPLLSPSLRGPDFQLPLPRDGSPMHQELRGGSFTGRPQSSGALGGPGSATLVGCFERAEDIPELPWLEECAAACPALDLFLFVAKPPPRPAPARPRPAPLPPASRLFPHRRLHAWLSQGPGRRSGRVDAAFLRDAVLAKAKALRFFYICGPPVFAHTIRAAATEIGVEPSALVSL